VRRAFLALAELRARLFWRRLRGRGHFGEGIALGVLFVVSVPLGLVLAGLIGAGSWRLARPVPGFQLEISLAAMFFGLWQAWTAVSLALTEREGLDLRRFLVYPLPPGRVWLFGLASGLAGDPVGLVWALLLGGILAGAAVGRPGPWLLGLSLDLALFAAATVLLVALLHEVLALLSRRRWAREILLGLAVAGAVAYGLSVAGAPRPGSALRDLVPLFSALKWLAWPAAMAARAARHLYAGQPAASLPWMAGLALASAATGWLAFRLALAAAAGAGGGGETGAARPDDGWRLGPWRGRLAALVEKEGKYLLRHPLVRISALVVPAMGALVAWKLSPRIPEEAGEVVRALPLIGFGLYTHMAMQVFWLNAFGWDRGGARGLFLAPLDLSEVLLAKNLALHVVSTLIFAATAALMLAVGGWVPAWALAAAAALHLGLAPACYALGNLVSVMNPRAAPFTVQRNAALSWLSGLAGMGIVSGATGLFSLPVLLALRLESPWLLPAAWTFLGAVGLWAWRRTLPAVGRLLASRRDAFLPVVCGDDA
jgi:ABC-2 type transport system permease protein